MQPRVRTTLRYVALGDSYTIGTGVEPSRSWPAQLVEALSTREIGLDLVANLAVNGRTSADLIRDQLPELDRRGPEFVSLLIGVNDVVQGVQLSRYAAQVDAILAVLRATLPANRIVTVAIPDYTVTPRGADYGDPDRMRSEIIACNAILADASARRAVRHVNVFDLSGRAAADRSLVAADGLHPSGGQYALWVDRIAPIVAGLLDEPPAADH